MAHDIEVLIDDEQQGEFARGAYKKVLDRLTNLEVEFIINTLIEDNEDDLHIIDKNYRNSILKKFNIK